MAPAAGVRVSTGRRVQQAAVPAATNRRESVRSVQHRRRTHVPERHQPVAFQAREVYVEFLLEEGKGRRFDRFLQFTFLLFLDDGRGHRRYRGILSGERVDFSS